MHELCMNMWHAKLKLHHGQKLNPNLPAHINNNQAHINNNQAWNIVIMLMKCDAWSYIIKFTKPNPKISRKTQKPQKFQKPQNLGLKCMNAWKKKVLGHLPNDLILVEAENAVD